MWCLSLEMSRTAPGSVGGGENLGGSGPAARVPALYQMVIEIGRGRKTPGEISWQAQAQS